MSDAFDDRRRALEEGYFQKLNQQAMDRLKNRGSETAARLSPITGKPMEQITIMGVVVDRCPDSGGIWLDAGELDEIVKAAAEKDTSQTFLSGFLSRITGK